MLARLEWLLSCVHCIVYPTIWHKSATCKCYPLHSTQRCACSAIMMAAVLLPPLVWGPSQSLNTSGLQDSQQRPQHSPHILIYCRFASSSHPRSTLHRAPLLSVCSIRTCAFLGDPVTMGNNPLSNSLLCMGIMFKHEHRASLDLKHRHLASMHSALLHPTGRAYVVQLLGSIAQQRDRHPLGMTAQPTYEPSSAHRQFKVPSRQHETHLCTRGSSRLTTSCSPACSLQPLCRCRPGTHCILQIGCWHVTLGRITEQLQLLQHSQLG